MTYYSPLTRREIEVLELISKDFSMDFCESQHSVSRKRFFLRNVQRIYAASICLILALPFSIAQCNFNDTPDYNNCDYALCDLATFSNLFSGNVDDIFDPYDSWHIKIPTGRQIVDITVHVQNEGNFFDNTNGEFSYNSMKEDISFGIQDNYSFTIEPGEICDRGSIRIICNRGEFSYSVVVALMSGNSINCSEQNFWIGPNSLPERPNNWTNGLPQINSDIVISNLGTSVPFFRECTEMKTLEVIGNGMIVSGELIVVPE